MIDPRVAVKAAEDRDDFIRKAERAETELRHLLEGLRDILSDPYDSASAALQRVRSHLNMGLHAEPWAPEPDAVGVTPAEAREILARFIDGHFSNAGKEGPRISIPADPLRDDDIRLSRFVVEAGRVMEAHEQMTRGLVRLQTEVRVRVASVASLSPRDIAEARQDELALFSALVDKLVAALSERR